MQPTHERVIQEYVSGIANPDFLRLSDEDFLAKYNPAERKTRGVWYTPKPAVNFIVRAVDDVLQSHFHLAQGVADTSTVNTGNTGENKTVHRVQVLDVATGTGTFLAEVVSQIHAKYKDQQGLWSRYVEQHLIPRLHGFEIRMASYAICHQKLAMLLHETGYIPTGAAAPRVNVYLTNNLEKPHDAREELPMFRWFSDESNEASLIKTNVPMRVFIGRYIWRFVRVVEIQKPCKLHSFDFSKPQKTLNPSVSKHFQKLTA